MFRAEGDESIVLTNFTFVPALSNMPQYDDPANSIHHQLARPCSASTWRASRIVKAIIPFRFAQG